MTLEDMQRIIVEQTALILDLRKRVQQLEMASQRVAASVIPIRPSTTRRSSMVLGEFLGDDGA